MAGINHDISTIRDWLRRGITSARLTFKRPDNIDDGGHTYALAEPRVFAHAYPTNRMEDALPSALLELSSVAWTSEAVVYELSVTLAVWDSGVHAPDVFHRAEIPGTWEQGSGSAYERADGARGATVDLCTFADALSRHCRREALTIGDGLQLVLEEGISFELIEDDELSRSGFRFGRMQLSIRDPLPPAPAVGATPTAERAEDAQAPAIQINSLL